jgi:hypothetical protein
MRGYIAITTSIILSLLVMAVALSLGLGSLFSRYHTVDFTDKRSSFVGARSCMNYVRYRLGLNSNYAGNETVNIAGYRCTIHTIASSPPNKIIPVHVVVGKATTNLKLTVVSSTLSTVSLEEVVKF